MQVAIVFLALLSAVTAVPIDETAVQNSDVPTRNNALEQIALDIIEDLRDIMINGNDDIPPLDPLFVENTVRIDLYDLFNLRDSYIEVAEMLVEKISTFEIDNLSITLTSILLQRYTVEIDGKIPELHVGLGHYDLSATALGFRIFGKGEATLKFIEPRIKATFVVGPRISISGLFINMISCNVAFGLRAFEPNFNGMFDSDITNDFINLFLAELLPELVVYFEEEITNTLSTVVLEVANEILRDLDLIGIIGGNNEVNVQPILAAVHSKKLLEREIK